MVRISANTSKPSNVQPRFEAISARHWPPFSERYHGAELELSNTLIIPSLEVFVRDAVSPKIAWQAYANFMWAWKHKRRSIRREKWPHADRSARTSGKQHAA